jgi:hypothetical protein
MDFDYIKKVIGYTYIFFQDQQHEVTFYTTVSIKSSGSGQGRRLNGLGDPLR